MSALNAAATLAALRTSWLGRCLEVHAQLPSTQNRVREAALEGAPEGLVVVAEEQTAGRGRLGRTWDAPPGSSLLLSMLLRPHISPMQSALVTAACSLGVLDAVESLFGLRLAVKWPNDIVAPSAGRETAGAQFRKLSGILTETATIGDHFAYCIVGIGLNCNLDPAALPSPLLAPTSLSALLGRNVDRAELLCALLLGVENHYLTLSGTPEGPELTRSQWIKRMVTLGMPVVVSADGSRLEGVAETVDSFGALIVRDSAGRLHSVHAADVTLRPAPQSSCTGHD